MILLKKAHRIGVGSAYSYKNDVSLSIRVNSSFGLSTSWSLASLLSTELLDWTGFESSGLVILVPSKALSSFSALSAF